MSALRTSSLSCEPPAGQSPAPAAAVPALREPDNQRPADKFSPSKQSNFGPIDKEATCPRLSQLGRVIIPVSDQDAAIAFYTEKLGFTLSADVPYGEGDRWVEVSPPDGGAAIALSTGMGEFQPGRETGIALTSADPKADHEELKSKGVEVDEELMGGDGTVPLLFMFRDADGNGLMIVEEAPLGQLLRVAPARVLVAERFVERVRVGPAVGGVQHHDLPAAPARFVLESLHQELADPASAETLPDDEPRDLQPGSSRSTRFWTCSAPSPASSESTSATITQVDGSAAIRSSRSAACAGDDG